MLNLPGRISEWLLHLLESQRAVAFALVDRRGTLAQLGGDLSNYGLSGVPLESSAAEQLPFLEGLLPLPETPFFLRSMTMPSGRVADIHLLADERDEEATWAVLLDVTAEHDEARKLQQKAYDMTLHSQREARLMAKLQTAHSELTDAHQALARSREELLRTHDRLKRELRDAARYVRAILPAPMTEPFTVEWVYTPSTELGGDSLGYHWLDADHFALYLLDVSGHGVGSSLLSAAVANVLRSGSLRNTNFHRPEEVLTSLNETYRMEHQSGLYFTIWYGVYHRPSGMLRHATAGHPPPVLVTGPAGAKGVARQLPGQGLPIGMLTGIPYEPESCTVERPARLYLFSDGVYEITRPDGSLLEFVDFQNALASAPPDAESELEGLLRTAWEIHGSETLEDDFSILKMTLR